MNSASNLKALTIYFSHLIYSKIVSNQLPTVTSNVDFSSSDDDFEACKYTVLASSSLGGEKVKQNK